MSLHITAKWWFNILCAILISILKDSEAPQHNGRDESGRRIEDPQRTPLGYTGENSPWLYHRCTFRQQLELIFTVAARWKSRMSVILTISPQITLIMYLPSIPVCGLPILWAGSSSSGRLVTSLWPIIILPGLESVFVLVFWMVWLILWMVYLVRRCMWYFGWCI